MLNIEWMYFQFGKRSPADFSLCSCACTAMFLSIELPCFAIFNTVRCIRIRIWPRATTTITTLTKKNTRTGFLENLVIVREIAYKRRRVAVPQASSSPLVGRCSNRTQSDLPCRRVSYWTRLERPPRLLPLIHLDPLLAFVVRRPQRAAFWSFGNWRKNIIALPRPPSRRLNKNEPSIASIPSCLCAQSRI